MPIYQYQCPECGHELEALQKFGDAPLTDCPSCGKPSLRKKLTAAAFHLKGTGWYVTDFRDKGKKPDAEKAKEAAPNAEAVSKPAADKSAPAVTSSTTEK